MLNWWLKHEIESTISKSDKTRAKILLKHYVNGPKYKICESQIKKLKKVIEKGRFNV